MTPKLRLIINKDDPRHKRFEIHAELCERCREAETPVDLCLHGLDLWLDKQAIKDIRELADRLKS